MHLLAEPDSLVPCTMANVLGMMARPQLDRSSVSNHSAPVEHRQRVVHSRIRTKDIRKWMQI